MCRRPIPANPADERPRNGFEKAGWFSLLTWNWVNTLLSRKGDISDENIWRLVVQDSTQSLIDRLGGQWDIVKSQTAGAGAHPKLVSAFLGTFAWAYVRWGIPAWFKTAAVLAQTQFLALLLDELRKPTVIYSAQSAYLYALGLILSGAAAILFHHLYFFQAWRSGMRWRMAATALLFRKSLRLRLDALVETSAGHIINLASSDVERFQKMCQYLTYMVLAPLEAVVIVWLLWREIGVAALAGIGVIILFVILQVIFSRMFGRLRHETALITDERVRLTGQVVSGIRVLKMYGWEPPFLREVTQVRSREMAKVTKASWLRGINEGLFVVVPILVAGASFLTYNALGDSYLLTPRKIFVSMSLFMLLQLDVTKFLQLGFESIAEVVISLKRLQQFMLLPEMPQLNRANATQAVASDNASWIESPVAIEVSGLSCSWSKKSAENEQSHTLTEISFSTPSGTLTTIVGTVGAGKTSLLMALLQELPAASGSVRVSGKVAYVSQSPWIITGTVRENIIFGLPFNAERYNMVVKACCLEHDMASFARGDSELIGERGINLSGGQRARIGLARACYVDADVYLLDDPLSAVDARVGRLLFENCICGFLSSKTRVLVTHQLQYLRSADSILVLSGGRVLTQGPFTQLAAALAAAESEVSNVASPNPATMSSTGSLGVALAELLRSIDDDDGEDEEDGEEGGLDPGQTGVVATRRRASTGSSSKSARESVHRARSLIARKVSAKGAPKEDVVNISRTQTEADVPAKAAAAAPQDGTQKDIIQKEGMQVGSVNGKTYGRYFAAAGGPFYGIYLLLLLLGGAVLMIYTSVWLANWGNMSATQQKESYYPSVYGAFVAACLVMSLWRSIAFFLVSMKASTNLHFAAFSRVLRAPVAYFDANPAGRILNRFSKDLGLVDDMLPATFFDFSTNTCLVAGTLVLVVVVNPWVLISLPFLAFSFLYLRKYYMTTARVVKRLESTSRSPIYSIMNECLQGLPVIRAFGMEHLLWKQFADASDANLRAYFAFLATSRWIGIRLDFVCLALLIVTAFACVAARDLASPALIGLILSQIINLAGAFQWTVRQSAEVENQMVSVERLLEYTELPIEEIDLKEPKASPLPAAWPAAGAISFNNVWMKYRMDLPHVLRGVTLDIAAGTKIGVVGRTGAGKSSLLLALLRLVEPDRRCEAGATASDATISVVTSGQPVCGISIDGVDIASVSLSSLRRAISTIPQDPVLYSGTIRSNLDPFNTHTDAQCVQALERVQLTAFLKQVGGLGYEIAEGGSNLSVGQRQLICLSRALLRNSRVILMDEATANVDADTDAAIQFAVRHAFKDATVITIAHRLGTVIDADGVLVMDQGVAAEFGPPHTLLQNPSGAFSSLVDETGPRISAKLRADAQAAYANAPVQVQL